MPELVHHQQYVDRFDDLLVKDWLWERQSLERTLRDMIQKYNKALEKSGSKWRLATILENDKLLNFGTPYQK